MSFITNIFLWLLPLVSIPLIIHLLNKRKIITIEFSSIQFLNELKSKSIKKINILQWLLLAIRTLIILFIVLMMSRPILKGYFPYLDIDQSSSLSIIIVDDSFSMSGIVDGLDRSEIIYNSYNQILKSIPENSRLCVVSLNNGILYEGIKKNIENLSILFPIGNGGKKISDIAGLIEKKFNKDVVNKEVFIITDGQASLYDNLDKVNFSDWKTYIITTQKLNKNLKINSIDIINDVIIKDKILDIEVEIHNNGLSNVVDNSIFLEINDIKVASANNINLDSGLKKKIEFNSTLPNFGYNYLKLCIQGDDDNSNDNCYYKSIYISPAINILFLNDDSGSLDYIVSAIESINNSSEFNIFNYNSKNYSDWDFNQLGEEEVLVISGYNSVYDDFTLFEQYLASKKAHLILMPSKYDSSDLLYGITGIDNSTSSDFTELSIEGYEKIPCESMIDLDDGIRQLDHFRIFKYIKQSINLNTKIPLNKSDSFWDSSFIQNSKVDIFYSSLDLEWNTLPLKGIFIQFIYELMYSNYNQNNFNRHIDDEFFLTITRDFINSKKLIHKNPEGQRFYISKNDGQFFVDNFSNTGIHNFYNSDSLVYSVAANPSIEESQSELISNTQIATFFNESPYFLNSKEDIVSIIQKNRQGYEMWRYLLWAISILIIFEMFISNPNKKEKK